MSIRQEQVQSLSAKIEAAGGGGEGEEEGGEREGDIEREMYATMTLADLEALEESLLTQQTFVKNRLGKDPRGRVIGIP